MMKLIGVFYFLCSSLFLYSQNCTNLAALNGDLENAPIPTATGQLGDAASWSAAPAPIPADLYSASATINAVGDGFPFCNTGGRQLPFSGDNYGGLLLNGAGGNFERAEYALDNPMAANTTYLISLRVSLGDRAKWAENAIGVSFSNTTQVFPAVTGPIIPLTLPDAACNPQCLNDKNDWVLVSALFTTGAVAGQQFLQLGPVVGANCSMTEPPSTCTTILDMSYYFFDDLAVEVIDVTTDYNACSGEITTTTCNTNTPLFYEWVYAGTNTLVNSPDLSCNNCPNPNVGVSTNTNVTLNVSSDPNGCILVSKENFTLLPAGVNWHQSTTSAQSEDVGNDVHVDAEDGLVFNTGYFQKSTVITDNFGPASVTLNTPNNNKSAYVSCYNDCGLLMWVMQEIQGATSEGIGIKSVGDIVYITVNFENATQLKTIPVNVTLTSPSAPLVASGTMVTYAFNKFTGDYIDHIKFDIPSLRFRAAAIDVDHQTFTFTPPFGSTITTEINFVYVCGKRDASDNHLFVQKLMFNLNTQSFHPTPIWNSNIFGTGVASSPNFVNDIEYDDQRDLVLVTGSFVDFLNTGIAPITTGGNRDAFIAWFSASNGNNLSSAAFGATDFSEGTAIVTNDNSQYHFCGNFGTNAGGSNIMTPFNLGSGLAALNQVGTKQNGYIFSLDASSGPPTFWADEVYIQNSRGDVFLTGAAMNDTEFNICGYYTRGRYVGAGGTPLPYGNLGGKKLFVSQWNYGSGAWTPSYNNTTIGGQNDNHTTSRISVDNDFAYITGSYLGNMSYFAGAPASGILQSVGGPNAFILRNDFTSGALERPAVAGNLGNSSTYQHQQEEILNTGNLTGMEAQDLHLTAFPNPVFDKVNIQIEGLEKEASIQVEVYNMLGKVLISKDIRTQSQFELDLSDFAKGMYLIKLTIGDKIESLQVIKS